MKTFSTTFATSAVAATLLAALVPAVSQAAGHRGERPITVYLTRHAEKKTTTTSTAAAPTTYDIVYDDTGTASITANGNTPIDKAMSRDDVCGVKKCAEELNPLGLARAELLADWFKRRGVTRRLDTVISSHKRRTFQTVAPTAEDANLTVMQFPIGGTELAPEGTTDSECPTLEAIRASQPGDTVLVAGHSGTLYDIMGDANDDCPTLGLGLNTDNDRRFPKDEDGKVRDFGDIWKVVIYPNGEARFAYRVNLQPKALFVNNFAR